MPGHKMMPPLPATDESEHDRFVKFAKAILAVPKPEVKPEQALSKLEAQKQKIEGKIAEVRQEIVKRKAQVEAGSKPSS